MSEQRKRGKQQGDLSPQTLALLKELTPKDRDELPIEERYVGTTQALFFETFRSSNMENPRPPYSLKRFDHTVAGVTYKSAYQIYINCTSEFEAAIKILGSWEHWSRLLSAPFFRKHIEAWREEMLLRDLAMARAKLYEATEAGNVQAARTLLAEGKETEKRILLARKQSKGKEAKIAEDKIVSFFGKEAGKN